MSKVAYITPDQLRKMFPAASPSTLQRNEGNAFLAPEPTSVDVPMVDSAQVETMRQAVKLGIRPTTDEAKLNKTETRYLRYLEGLQPMWLGVQCITLKLGHDCRLTMDFAVLDKDGLRLIDTKATRKDTGRALVKEDAMIKMRLAARIYPWIRFVVAHEDGLVWHHIEIKP